MTSLTIEQKRVDIYPSAKPGSPVIYLNTFSNAVNSVYKNLMALGCPDFCLVAVSQLKRFTTPTAPPRQRSAPPITVVIVELCWRTVPIPSVILY